jgi:hypothetical protein
MDIILQPQRCSNCGEVLIEDNYSGFFDIELNELGFEIQVPVCNECNLSDDGVSGAY